MLAGVSSHDGREPASARPVGLPKDRAASYVPGPLHRAPGAAERTRPMFFHQVTMRLKTRARGFHLVTDEILAGLPELGRLRIGFLHLFLQHTSASLLINENA